MFIVVSVSVFAQTYTRTYICTYLLFMLLYFVWWRFGLVVTRWSRSTKLLYVGPG